MTQKIRPSVAGFFAGAGGLDLGFKNAGFEVPWANEYDRTIWQTYENNFPKTLLDRRSIIEVRPRDIPHVTGFVGGPPCQSWSEAGSLRGIDDKRGQLFFEYLRLIEASRPKFFLAENVSGILFDRHGKAFSNILESFTKLGYNVSYGMVNARDYGVPQDRDRVIIVGYQASSENIFTMPSPTKNERNLRDAISDLPRNPIGRSHSDPIAKPLKTPNHEYLTGGFSSMYLSRNRVRSWDEPSFTIQAGGRHAPLHPQAPKMTKVEKDLFEFTKGYEQKYRRLSVRECARIQTFPDDFIFHYSRIINGYKMIGNAVPVLLAQTIAEQIKEDLESIKNVTSIRRKRGEIVTFQELGLKEKSA
jgi:DNA (cytosine-5)-methyltransferase 1